MELFRKDLKALRQQSNFCSMDRDFACFCAENFSSDADYITYVKFFEILISFLSQTVPCHIGLNTSFQILHMTKRCLTHYTFGHHTARYCNCLIFKLVKMIFYFLAMMCYIIFYDFEWVFPICLQICQLFPADLQQLVQILLLLLLLFCHFRASLFL